MFIPLLGSLMLSEAATSRRPLIGLPAVIEPVLVLPPEPLLAKPVVLLVVPLDEAFTLPPTELLPVPVVLRLPLIVSVAVLVLDVPVPDREELADDMLPVPTVVEPLTLPAVPEFMLLVVLPVVSCRICSVVRLVIIPSCRELVIALESLALRGVKLPVVAGIELRSLLPVIDCS